MSWVFRPLPGFIKDETQSASGLCPKNWGAAHPRRPFCKRSIKTLKLFCDSPIVPYSPRGRKGIGEFVGDFPLFFIQPLDIAGISM